MNVDKFGLGDWWPRPKQAAAGGLDHLPVDEWPWLATMWIAAGYNSQPLRQIAGLEPREDPPRRGQRGPVPAVDLREALLKLMPEVLRSIGFDPGPADEEFGARCQNALDIVQHDLDVTGYGQYQMRARRSPGQYAIMYATLPDGSHWNAGGGMTRDMDGARLLFAAAESASATIEEMHEIEWPICADHGDDPRIGWEPATLIRKVAWWQCTRSRHALAPVGQLTATIARSL